MAKIEDCPGFETFGADVKAARKAKQLSRSALADMIHCDSRYLANIENEGTLLAHDRLTLSTRLTMSLMEASLVRAET